MQLFVVLCDSLMSRYLALKPCFNVAIGAVVQEFHVTLFMSQNLVLNLSFEITVAAYARRLYAT